jgi:hypothetical protein
MFFCLIIASALISPASIRRRKNTLPDVPSGGTQLTNFVESEIISDPAGEVPVDN